MLAIWQNQQTNQKVALSRRDKTCWLCCARRQAIFIQSCRNICLSVALRRIWISSTWSHGMRQAGNYFACFVFAGNLRQCRDVYWSKQHQRSCHSNDISNKQQSTTFNKTWTQPSREIFMAINSGAITLNIQQINNLVTQQALATFYLIIPFAFL